MQPACRRALAPALATVLLVLPTALAGTAYADLTAFAGTHRATASPWTLGVSLGMSLRLTGIEFEYARTPADEAGGTASLETGMANLLVHSPLDSLGPFQIYGTVGGGVYRERLAGWENLGAGVNAGGGVTVALAEPFRFRVDYRRFALRDGRRVRSPERVYAGVTLAF